MPFFTSPQILRVFATFLGEGPSFIKCSSIIWLNLFNGGTEVSFALPIGDDTSNNIENKKDILVLSPVYCQLREIDHFCVRIRREVIG